MVETAAAPQTPHDDDSFWPTPPQRWLLCAALARGDDAGQAWEHWQRQVAGESELDAVSEDLLPAVAWNLDREGVDSPLRPLLEPFRERTRRETEAHALRAAELLQALRDADVPTLALKGLALGALYYRDPAARPMADVDFAVPSHRRAEARGVLERLGWSPSSDLSAESLRFRHSLDFERAGDSLDLHWHVCFESCTPGLDEPFWRTARVTRLVGVETRVLHPTEQLLHVLRAKSLQLENPAPAQQRAHHFE